MSCHLCLCSLPEPQFTPSLQSPVPATYSASSCSFSAATTGREHFLADFLWGLRLKEDKKWEFGCECAGWILDKGAFGSVGWLPSGLHMKDFYSNPEKTWFSGQGLTYNRQYIHMIIAFGQQIAFGNLGIIAIMQGHMQKKLHKKEESKRNNWNVTRFSFWMWPLCHVWVHVYAKTFLD